MRAPVDGEAFLVGRTAERMRSEIRIRFGFREATIADADALNEWLRDHAAAGAGGEIEAMVERLEARCRELAIEPPTVERVERIARAALRAHEERFHADIYGRLSTAMRERLDELLGSAEGEGDLSEAEEVPGSAPAALLKLRGNPGRPSLASQRRLYRKSLSWSQSGFLFPGRPTALPWAGQHCTTLCGGWARQQSTVTASRQKRSEPLSWPADLQPALACPPSLMG